ncbi:MAG: hypothetical protein E7158_05200 [Firmicutes bacterium]|nr:hypothetical protein [Bacillota bacterium]
MKALSLETTKLLDKLYNLRGKDSVVLVEMDKQKEKSEKTLERTTKEKSDLQDKITNLETQHDELETQGDKLLNALSGIDRDEFSTVLECLNLDFDPQVLMERVNSNLPKTIEKVSEEQKKAEEELVAVEEEMNNAMTTIEELGLRRDTALSNQDKLNEYFDMALNGKINITRDSITNLLEQFDFSEEEQREAAKILMFPEDALYAYEEKINGRDIAGKSISDVMSEAKDAIDDTPEEIKESNDTVDLHENDINVDSVIDNKSLFDLNETFNIETNVENEPQEIKEEKILVSEEEPFKQEEVFNPFLIEETNNNESDSSELNIDDFVLNSNSENESDVKLEEYLNELGFNYLDFRSEDLDDLNNNFDKSLFKENVDTMKQNNIDLDIFTEHSSLLYDKELKEKVELLLGIGKEPIDIYLNPSILIKYTTEKLNNAIELLRSNGMDPRNVPLMAY